MQNKVVLHFLNRRIAKGITQNFHPQKKFLHMTDNNSKEVTEVQLSDLKAVYFVKTFEGDPAYKENNVISRSGLGKRVRIRFKDGETLYGYTQSFSQRNVGFSVFPADPGSNNERIFINRYATDYINLVKEADNVVNDEEKDEPV